MTKQKDDIDVLLDELKDTKKLGGMIPFKAPKATDQPNVTEENINEFIMQKTSLLVQQGIDTLEQIKNAVQGSGNAEEVDSYSKLVTAVASTIDTLNKVNLQNKKAKTSKELKEMDMEMRQGQLSNRSGVTNVLIAPREEMMDKIFGKAEELVIDALYEDDERSK